VVIRENTEGEYSGIEHEVYPGVIESIKVTTMAASLRIAEYAFEFALLSGRKKVTAVHKANIMKLVDGMFLNACREVSSKYPYIKYEEMIIDNCCMQVEVSTIIAREKPQTIRCDVTAKPLWINCIERGGWNHWRSGAIGWNLSWQEPLVVFLGVQTCWV
jgi:Isocitrate/isopropylmalate dehydrogenase